MKNFILAFCLLALTACSTLETKETPKNRPEIPDVTCSENELYLVYQEKELVVKVLGVFCVLKEKGTV